MDNLIVLERFSYAPDGTFGRLKFPNGFECFTVERPWIGNQVKISCIPEGVYFLGLRESPVVKRVTNGRYEDGWEVEDVPGRTYIMIHPGNWPKNFQGCIGVGDEYKLIGSSMGVSNSQDTFDKVMEIMNTRSDWELLIKQYRPEYP